MTLRDATIRNDGHQQNVVEANRHLKELRKEKYIFLIQHDKTITTRHLNGSKLHLTKRSTEILSNIFIDLFLILFIDNQFDVVMVIV